MISIVNCLSGGIVMTRKLTAVTAISGTLIRISYLYIYVDIHSHINADNFKKYPWSDWILCNFKDISGVHSLSVENSISLLSFSQKFSYQPIDVSPYKQEKEIRNN